MTYRLIVAMAGFAISAPLAVQAQDAYSTVTLRATVGEACSLGDLDTTTLNLGDLTGPDGRLGPALVSTNVSAAAVFGTAWCNGPSTLKIDASPLNLEPNPAYGISSGFSRQLTYTATVVGWDNAVSHRPLVGDTEKTSAVTAGAIAAAPNLELRISQIGTLAPGGASETPGLLLEAGDYRGVITITLAHD